MTINATLIVQMINFCITWVIIKYLFVHPVVRIRAGIRHSVAVIEQERNALLDALSRSTDARYKLWHGWYLQSRNLIKERSVTLPQPSLRAIRCAAPELPVHEIEALIDRLTARVLSHVEEKS